MSWKHWGPVVLCLCKCTWRFQNLQFESYQSDPSFMPLWVHGQNEARAWLHESGEGTNKDSPAQSTTGPAGCSRGCSVRRVERATEEVRSFPVLQPGAYLVHFYLLR